MLQIRVFDELQVEVVFRGFQENCSEGIYSSGKYAFYFLLLFF